MANKKISDLTAASSIAAGDLFELEDAGGSSHKVTGAVLKTWATGWTLISSISPSGAPSVDVNGLSAYNEVLVIARGLTATVSGVRRVSVSVDNGATFDATVANYLTVAATGVEASAATAAVGYHSTNSTAARTLIVHIKNLKGAEKEAVSPAGDIIYVGGSGLDINAIRVDNHTGGTISGGPIRVYAR